MSKTTNPPPVLDEDEVLIQNCIKIVSKEKKAGVSLLQRRLRLGYSRANAIMHELERRGVVGPMPKKEPFLRDVFPVAPAESEDAASDPNPRKQFLSANPKAAEVWAIGIAEFREKFSRFAEGDGKTMPVKAVLGGVVEKSEQARQIGIVLVELSESLPGKELTRDFYEQHREDFADARGQAITYELLQWFIRVARNNLAPITDFLTADRWLQPLLLTAGVVQPPKRIAAGSNTTVQNPYHWITGWLDDVKDMPEQLAAFRNNPQYGDLCTLKDRRPDLHFELRAKFKAVRETVDGILTELN